MKDSKLLKGYQILTDCKALLIDPANEVYNRYDRKFSYFTRERNTFNFNKGVDIEPGESKKVILALTPREIMNREVEVEF